MSHSDVQEAYARVAEKDMEVASLFREAERAKSSGVDLDRESVMALARAFGELLDRVGDLFEAGEEEMESVQGSCDYSLSSEDQPVAYME